MKLYTKLLKTFAKAGILFGIIIGLFLGLMTNYTIGLIYGFFAGCLLWVGVPSILVMLSSLKKSAS